MQMASMTSSPSGAVRDSVRLNAEIPAELHRAIKIQAASEGRSVRAVVVELITTRISPYQSCNSGDTSRNDGTFHGTFQNFKART